MRSLKFHMHVCDGEHDEKFAELKNYSQDLYVCFLMPFFPLSIDVSISLTL